MREGKIIKQTEHGLCKDFLRSRNKFEMGTFCLRERRKEKEIEGSKRAHDYVWEGMELRTES